jgi:O-antigen/teichoic acid export membrane protein
MNINNPLIFFFSSATRTGRFFRSLASSYILLGAATLFSFLSVAMALHFTNSSRLGLWVLITQMGTYLTVIDAGLSTSSIRQFVGPLTRKDMPALAIRFQATLFISVLQGLFIILWGASAHPIALLLKIPTQDQALFHQLFVAQCFLVGVSFPIRPFNSILLARQCFEFNYLVSAASFLFSIGVTWLGFRAGFGIWSLFAGNILQVIASSAVSLLGVHFLGYYPFLFNSWQVSLQGLRSLLRESLSFASSPLLSVCSGLLQSTALSRYFGLEGVALWNVGSKMVVILSQVLSKFFESSFGGLSELIEQNLREQMLRRSISIFFATVAAAIVLGCAVLLFNDALIKIWTRGAFHWPFACTIGAAIYLVTTTISKGLSEQVKILLLWKWIRMGPILEFSSLLFGLSIVSFWPFLPVFVFVIALSPIFGSALANAIAIKNAFGGSWSQFVRSK